MNFGQAFTFVFEDPDWVKKVLIPALVTLIPIVGVFVLMGWMMDITRRVIQKNPRPLPELDFGRQLGEGFKGFVVALVYSLPMIIMIIPIAVASSMMDSMDPDTYPMVIGIVSVCCGGLTVFYGLFMAYAIPAALGNLAARGNLGAAFRFSEVFGLLRAAPGAYLMVLLGVIVAGFISGAGTIACVIGAFATMAYGQAVLGHLYGQAYSEATVNKGFAQAY